MAKITTRLAVIGAGKMGETIISGLLKAGVLLPESITASDPSDARLQYFQEKFGVNTTRNNAEAVAASDTILFCIKPQNAEKVFSALRNTVTKDHLVISIMAGVTLNSISDWLIPEVPAIRVMPNTPTLVSAGMSAIARGSFATDQHLALTELLFNGIGRTIVLDEKHFDAVTGLSASGPAFIYIVIEALADGGVKSGLPRGVAIELAAQMTLGAAKMVLETGQHPAILKDDVTTPAGCTTDGILALEEGGVRVTLIKAVTEATRRAKELG